MAQQETLLTPLELPTTRAFLWQLIRPYRGKMLLGSLLLIISAGAMLALPQYLRHMFDTALQTQNSAGLAKLAAIMFGTVMVLAATIIWRARLIQMTTNKVINDLRRRLTEAMLKQDAVYFETQPSGAFVSRLTTDTFALWDFLVMAAPQLIRGVILGLGTLLALLYTSPSLTAILLLAGAPIALLGRWLGRRIRLLSRQRQDNFAVYGARVEEMVTNIRTVMAFNQQDRQKATLHALTDETQRIGDKRAILSASFVATNVIIGFVALIAVVWLGGLRVMHGTMSTGDMMAFLLYLAFLADAAGSVSNFWPAWQSTLGAVERVLAILQQQPTITDPASPKLLPTKIKDDEALLEFHNVAYAYPSRPESLVLQSVSVRIAQGQNVALVGPSGAGKSTLFRLLLRLDDPTEGQIKLHGVPLDELKLADVRHQFALVAQESPLFTGTVAENVAFAKPNATPKQIEAALKASHAADFVKAMPSGMDTQVGEKGIQLSGGQKQRIAMARAILADAPILLLDEATSHLDSESEAAIQEALARLTVGKTVITIAHRLATVKSADVILVMDKGQIVAFGTHDQLLRKSPLYKALATLQLQDA
jgi:ATP-binding cassette subfamily B protein